MICQKKYLKNLMKLGTSFIEIFGSITAPYSRVTAVCRLVGWEFLPQLELVYPILLRRSKYQRTTVDWLHAYFSYVTHGDVSTVPDIPSVALFGATDAFPVWTLLVAEDFLVVSNDCSKIYFGWLFLVWDSSTAWGRLLLSLQTSLSGDTSGLRLDFVVDDMFGWTLTWYCF